MRINDWSSDVCSSDLNAETGSLDNRDEAAVDAAHDEHEQQDRGPDVAQAVDAFALVGARRARHELREIGSASCRDRGCQPVLSSVVAVSLQIRTSPTIRRKTQ